MDFDGQIALLAARVSVQRGLPMADSIILATAEVHGATVWTQDADFEGLPSVEYRPRRQQGLKAQFPENLTRVWRIVHLY